MTRTIIIAALVLLAYNLAGATQPEGGDASSMAYSNAYSQQQTDVRVGVGVGVKAEGGAGGMGGSGGAGGAGGAGGSGGTGGNATGGTGGSANAIGGTGGQSSASAGSAQASAGGSTSAVTVKSQGSRAAYAPDILATPTAPCRVAVGISAGWLGGALGLGGSVLDEGCHIRETARVLAGLGLIVAAVRALCQDPVAAKALGEVCKD